MRVLGIPLVMGALLLPACIIDATDGDGEGGEAGTSDSADEGDDGDGEAGTDTGTVECGVPLDTCPDDAFELGVAGQTVVESFDLEWTYDDECGVSLADPVYVFVTDDVLGLGISVENGAVQTGLLRVESNGTTLIDGDIEGPTGFAEPPFKHIPTEVGSLAFPMSETTFTEAGCLALQPFAFDDLSGSTGNLNFVTRRAEGNGAIDLNLIVVEGTDITDEELNAAVDVMNGLYENGNAAVIGDVQIFDIATSGGASINAEGEDVHELRANSVTQDPLRMNLFFIADFAGEPGTLGIAAGIPGPNGVDGTVASGVIMAVDAHLDGEGLLNVQLLGETMAHEAGHQLGLFHTTEGDGSAHDVIADTPECTLDDDADGDEELIASECPDGNNFMFWTSAEGPQEEVSVAQSDVIYFNPIGR